MDFCSYCAEQIILLIATYVRCLWSNWLHLLRVNRGWLDCNSGPLISFLHTTKSTERKWFDPEFSVSRDGNPEHFHGFKEKHIWRILTQAATIIGKDAKQMQPSSPQASHVGDDE